jgi:hypothetical protein
MFPQLATTNLIDFLSSITLREGEARESWRAVDQHEVDKIKSTPIAKWGFGASGLIETAEKVVKVSHVGDVDVDLDFDFSYSLACMIAPDCNPGTRGVLCSWVMPHTQRLPYARIFNLSSIKAVLLMQ